MADYEFDIGSGGDYSTWYDVQNYLSGAGDISGDSFTLTQISNITETTTGAKYNGSTNGDPPTIIFDGAGFTTTTPGGVIWFGITSGFNGWTGIVRNFIINMTNESDESSEVGIFLAGRLCDGSEIHDNFVYSLVDGYNKGVHPNNVNTSNHGYWSVYNCLFYNLQQGIYLDASGGSSPGSRPNRRYIKNCSMLNCGKTVGENKGYALTLELVGLAEIQAINVSLLRNDDVTEHDLDYSDTTCTADNCATTDESTFADLEDLYPAQITDCLDNLDPSEHLKSTVLGSSKFLRPKIFDGTGIYNGGIDPVSPVYDYDGIEYGVDGNFPIGAFQYLSSKRKNIIGVV